MAEEEKFEIVRNINVSLVDEAQANVGVPFKGVDETGIIGGEFGGIKNKPNAKTLIRQKVEEYDPERDNVATPDQNPFDSKIKLKNDKSRSNYFTLLNGMSKIEGIRLDSIELEISQDLEKEQAKPEPDPLVEKILTDEKTRIEQMKELAKKGRDVIEFPPRK